MKDVITIIEDNQVMVSIACNPEYSKEWLKIAESNKGKGTVSSNIQEVEKTEKRGYGKKKGYGEGPY